MDILRYTDFPYIAKVEWKRVVATVASIGCLVGGTALFFSLYEVAMKEIPLKLESLNLTSLPIPEELLPNTASKIHTYSIVFASIITLLAVTLYSGICGFVRAARNSSHAGALRDFVSSPRTLSPLSHTSTGLRSTVASRAKSSSK